MNLIGTMLSNIKIAVRYTVGRNERHRSAQTVLRVLPSASPGRGNKTVTRGGVGVPRRVNRKTLAGRKTERKDRKRGARTQTTSHTPYDDLPSSAYTHLPTVAINGSCRDTPVKNVRLQVK